MEIPPEVPKMYINTHKNILTFNIFEIWNTNINKINDNDQFAFYLNAQTYISKPTLINLQQLLNTYSHKLTHSHHTKYIIKSSLLYQKY